MELWICATGPIVEAIIALLEVSVVVGIIYGLTRLIFGNRHTKEIIEAEQRRKTYPNSQSGKFTRLYTMPYYADLTGQLIGNYCNEHFPKYKCAAADDFVSISDGKKGLGGETRHLHITHLKDENITAIRIEDPNEVEYTYKHNNSTMRSSLYDMGFGDDLREMIRLFQSKAIEHQNYNS